MQVTSDTDLLLAWKSGNREAYAVLVVRYEALVLAACQRQAPRAEVDDCVQAVFLVLLRRPSSATKAPVLAAWLLSTADLVCRNARRAERRRRQAESALPPPVAVAEPTDDPLRYLDGALARLPRRQREVITLRYLIGLPPETIADRLDLSRDNVYQLISRGLAGLRQHFALKGVALGATGIATLLVSQSASAAVFTTSITTVSAGSHLIANLTGTPSTIAVAHATKAITSMKIVATFTPLLVGALIVASGTLGLVLGADVTPPSVAAVPAVETQPAPIVIRSLPTDGRPVSAFMGVTVNFQAKELAGVTVDSPDRGKVTPLAILEDIMPGSPADLMGLQTGDRLLRWNGETPNQQSFFKARGEAKPGQPVTLEIERRGQFLTLTGFNGGLAHGPHPDDASPMVAPTTTFVDTNPLRGAFCAGGRPAAYWAFRDGTTAPGSTEPAWCYRSHAANVGTQFGTWMTQGPTGERLRQLKGQRLRLSARLKGENVSGYAGLWMRTDIGRGGSYRLGRFDNMKDRGLKGTFDWTTAAVVLDLQPEIDACMFGFILTELSQID